MADIWAYIAKDSVEAADRYLDRIRHQIELTADHPERGERDHRVGNRRRFLVDSHLVFYSATEEILHILRVYHGARPIEDLTFPEGTE